MEVRNVPSVTVLLCVFNGEEFLRQCIDSILSQTFKNFELLIVNDGSIDNSLNIIQSYTDRRIRIINNPTNIGLTASLNLGIQSCMSEYVARIDADDICSMDRLEKQFLFLKKNPNTAACGSYALVINSQGDITGKLEPPCEFDVIKTRFLFSNILVHSSVMFRKSYVAECNGYDDSFKKAQDYKLWSNLIILNYEIRNIPEYLIKYRSHKASISNSFSESQEFYTIKAIQEHFLSFLSQHIEVKTISAFRRVKNNPDRNRIVDRLYFLIYLRQVYRGFRLTIQVDDLAQKVYVTACGYLGALGLSLRLTEIIKRLLFSNYFLRWF